MLLTSLLEILNFYLSYKK